MKIDTEMAHWKKLKALVRVIVRERKRERQREWDERDREWDESEPLKTVKAYYPFMAFYLFLEKRFFRSDQDWTIKWRKSGRTTSWSKKQKNVHWRQSHKKRWFLKNRPTPFSFYLFAVFSNKQYNVKKCHVHPVYGARIRTHELFNMSRLPQPLDQGSRPKMFLTGRQCDQIWRNLNTLCQFFEGIFSAWQNI